MRSADKETVRKVAFRLAILAGIGTAAAVLAIRVSVPTVLALLYW